MKPFLIIIAIVALFGMGSVAGAQQPTPVERALGAAIQGLTASVQLYDEQVRRERAALQARIAELEKLCGEPCAPKKPDEPVK